MLIAFFSENENEEKLKLSLHENCQTFCAVLIFWFSFLFANSTFQCVRNLLTFVRAFPAEEFYVFRLVLSFLRFFGIYSQSNKKMKLFPPFVYFYVHNTRSVIFWFGILALGNWNRNTQKYIQNTEKRREENPNDLLELISFLSRKQVSVSLLTLNSLLSLIRSCARVMSPIFGRPSNAILSFSVKSSGALASASVIAFANSSSWYMCMCVRMFVCLCMY